MSEWNTNRVNDKKVDKHSTISNKNRDTTDVPDVDEKIEGFLDISVRSSDYITRQLKLVTEITSHAIDTALKMNKIEITDEVSKKETN